MPPRSLVEKILPPIGFALWIFAAVVGMHATWTYASTPGDAAEALSSWPSRSKLFRASDRPSILLFAHPQCPCTRASIAELGEILEQRAGPVEATVVFVRPPGTGEEWTRSASWDQAASIPGVRVVVDENGEEAARFGARTSGSVLVYSKSGQLVFSGGITPMRGEAGPNSGRAHAEEALAGHAPANASSPVFGCSLLGDETAAAPQLAANGAKR